MFDVGVLNTNLANALQSDKQTFEISDDSKQLVNFTNDKWKPTWKTHHSPRIYPKIPFPGSTEIKGSSP